MINPERERQGRQGSSIRRPFCYQNVLYFERRQHHEFNRKRSTGIT